MIQREPGVMVEPALSVPLVLFIGAMADRALEAIAARDSLTLRAISLPDVAAAIQWIDREAVEPALIVVAQAWPGEVSEQQILALRRAAPLARMCAVVGSWCEGQTRSGRPWPGVWRVYAHQWPQRGPRELAALAAGRPTVWNLPATATAEEQLLGEIDLVARRPAGDWSKVDDTRGPVAIIAASAAAGAALADACRSLGYQASVWRTPPTALDFQPVALLWDATAQAARNVTATVAQIKAIAAGSPTIALLGFPRPDENERAEAAGITAVLSKPFLLADLAWQLAAVTVKRLDA